MSYATDKVFGRRETVHIVSPDFLSLPKIEIKLPAGVKVAAGHFVNAQGQLLTLTDKVKIPYLILEDSHYNDMLDRVKPSGVIEGFYSNFVMHTKVFTEAGTAIVAGDQVSVKDGKICLVNATNTIAVGEVVGRGTDYLIIAMI